jgi:hypothetical protein
MVPRDLAEVLAPYGLDEFRGIVRLKKTDSKSHSARVAHGTDCGGERR